MITLEPTKIVVEGKHVSACMEGSVVTDCEKCSKQEECVFKKVVFIVCPTDD